MEVVKLSEVVGGGYGQFWSDRHTYRVVKGGRASKKSSTMALWVIYHMHKHPLANTLVVRQTANTHETSTYAELQKATERLKVKSQWKFTLNPCEATLKATGQKILFRGFDDPLKLTSLNVAKGVLCWIWLEEVFEMDNEEAFDTLCEGIRGKEIGDAGLWKSITLTYNPWVNSHWTKTKYWDTERTDTFRLTTTHKDNEFLMQSDHDEIEALAISNPDRYKVVGLGEYGIPGGAYFDEFRSDIHVIPSFKIPDDWRRYVTIDYGLDMFACYFVAFDWHNNAYVYKEIYKSGLVISAAAKLLKEAAKGEKIHTYFAPPDLWNRQRETGASTAELFLQNGIVLVKASNNRIQGWYNLKEWLKPFTNERGVMTSPLTFFKNHCPNLVRCLPQVQCDEKNPNDVSDTPHELTHSCDAIRYLFSGRPRSGKEAEQRKYPINSLEEKIEKNLERLLKANKRRSRAW